MVNVSFEPRELELLAELVKSQLDELRAELRRTEKHEVREQFKERQALLGELAARLGAAAAPRP